MWIQPRDSKVGTRPIKGYDLIICCGARTEMNYFSKATQWMIDNVAKSDAAKIFIVECDAVDPLNMAKNAPERKKEIEISKGIKIDQVWVVFDKDNFEDAHFNSAIEFVSKYKEEGSETVYFALWTNKCFELWLLLHFHLAQSVLDIKDYIPKLTTELGEKYDKKDNAIFNKVMTKGSLSKAIKYAQKLLNEDCPPANNNPATTVHEFFLFYSRYLGILGDEFN